VLKMGGGLCIVTWCVVERLYVLPYTRFFCIVTGVLLCIFKVYCILGFWVLKLW